MSDKGTPVKAGIWYTVGNMLIKGINFLTIPIFSRIMTTDELGVYSVFMAYDAILFVIIGLSIHSSIKSANYKFKDEINEYTSSILIIYFINLAFFLLLVLIFKNFISVFLSIRPQESFFLVFYAFGNAVLSLYNSRLSLDYSYKKYLIISFVNSIFNIILSLALILTAFRSDKSEGRILGTTLTVFIISIYAAVDIFKRAKPRLQKKYWEFALKYSLPIIPHGLSQIILSQFDRIMIKHLVDDSSAGIYSFAANIKLILTVITDSVATAWTTWFYEKICINEIKVIRKNAMRLCVAAAVFSVGLMAISPELIFILGGDKYELSKYVSIPMVIDAFIIFLYNIIVPAEYYMQKTVYIMSCTIIAAIINIVLNYIFIRRYGFIAAAYTTLAAYIIYLLLHWIISYKLVKFNIISPCKTLIIFILIVLLGIVDLVFIKSILIRYIMSAVFVIPTGLKLLVDLKKERDQI